MRDYVQEHFDKHKGASLILDALMRPIPSIVCADGYRFSVQASATHYCTPRDNVGPWSRFEIWGPRTLEPEGWVRKSLINRRIKYHGGIQEE